MALNLGSLVKTLKRTDQIITPRLNEWLLSHGDEAVKGEVLARITELMGTEPRYRGASFSASSAGFCHRKQVLGFLDAEGGVVDPQLQNIFNDGKWRHLRWQAMLLTAGLLTDVEVSQRWKAMRAVGTMDGQGVVYEGHPRNHWVGKEFGFELKGVSGYLYSKFANDGPKEDHLNQVHRYFLMSGLDLFVIIYEDKSTQQWSEWVIEPDQERLDAQREELEWLNESVSRRELPTMLTECKKRRGDAWRDCAFAGSNGPCVLAREWPRETTEGFERSKSVKEFPRSRR